MLLPIELCQICNYERLSVSKIDQQFTINHDQQTYYKLAGFSICTQKHFNAILANKGQYRNYDGLEILLLNHGSMTPSFDQLTLYSTSCPSLTNSYRFTTLHFPPFERQGTSNFVGNSARGYSGNAIPIMESPDIGNANCYGTPPVANNPAISIVSRERQRN